ncbi:MULTISPECIES: cell division protein FtsQ/DivIB [Gammaproteobacteria]|uniref:cell division protein FtsQ/DivIB n=1 Tax=Gammaproteobacteria TaxID=1236 RepID=UPI000DD07D48|nr:MULTISPECIES: cell division protein FtsQ/DivIB [Gammaproteobacteria]RTE86315.1 FtsQ-type POTRA domain-containing protein [Aliidiomarina sp. B3213]TCZ91665.1 FtsQ-type POTRA domain-containing protein [Lysobacter sp. N42]
MSEPVARTGYEFWAGVVVFICILAGLITGIAVLFKVVTDVEQTPFTEVVIKGERVFTTTDDVVGALRSERLGGFFTADADVLRQRVEGLPWIYSASIRREWPGTLHVFLVEQQAQALWNNEAVLNVQGEVFNAPVADVKGRVPELYGPADNVEETLDYFQRFQTLLEQGGFSIQVFRLSDRFSANLVLQNGIELRLGRESQIERIQRFMDLLPVIREEKEEQIDYIDLRYDTGAAVGWQETSTGE